MDSPIVDEISDEEVYFGKLTIKEIKKMLCLPRVPSKTLENVTPDDENTSLRLIETQSQPNLRCRYDSPLTPASVASHGGNSDDSFIQMENVVSKLCLSPRKSDNVELNNTLEIIDYILKHGANQATVKAEASTEQPLIDHMSNDGDKDVIPPLEGHHSQQPPPLIDHGQTQDSYKAPALVVDHQSPIKKFETKKNEPHSPNYYTPAKTIKQNTNTQFKTPICQPLDLGNPSNVKATFKTPSCRSVLKKPSTPRNTPGRSNAYGHISSPIATYIKNSPHAPLVKDVHPKKPLPAVSCIPKLVRSAESKENVKEKENVNLPSIAYKSAKKTKVVQIPDVNKMPQSQWAKKITSSLPKVMKHEDRKMSSAKKSLKSNFEDTLTDLSCHQAEVSLCTQKSAFKPTNRH